MFELELSSTWPFGNDLAEEILNAITYVASQKPPFKIETDGYRSIGPVRFFVSTSSRRNWSNGT